MVTPIGSNSRNQAARSDASRLWAAGLATAVVAGLVAVVGAVVSRAVLDVALLPADYAGILGWSASASYGVGAMLLALLLTGVLHLLLVAVQRPVVYFGWIAGLVGVILVVAPFAYEAPRASQLATSVVSGLVIVVIGSLLIMQASLLDRRTPARAGP